MKHPFYLMVQCENDKEMLLTNATTTNLNLLMDMRINSTDILPTQFISPIKCWLLNELKTKFVYTSQSKTAWRVSLGFLREDYCTHGG